MVNSRQLERRAKRARKADAAEDYDNVGPTRTLTVLAMLIMTMLASGWALVRVVPGQCRRRHLARIVRIANLQGVTGYDMMLGVQLGTKI